MSTRGPRWSEIVTVYAAGLFQGLSLVAVPAAATVLTSTTAYDLSASQYGLLSTMLRWLRSMIGRGRAEREFSTAHTGGDLSLPETVREIVEPAPFPNAPAPADRAHP